jgi:hypothetical protein
MKNFNTIFWLLAILTLTGCAQRKDNEVPKDWLASAPGASASQSTDAAEEEAEITPAPALGEKVDQIFTAESESLERAEAASTVVPETVPQAQRWHLTAFMADLGISMSGVLGALVYKGTPSVTAIFRKQYAKPDVKPETVADAVALTPMMSHQDLAMALEPGIQATLATGRVKDEKTFRTEAMGAAQEFQVLTRSLQSMDESLSWKVSRFRLDLSVDVSGKVTPVISVGGDLRLRFEWFRMKPPTHALPRMAAAQVEAAQASELSEGLVKFASGIAEDLVELSDDSVVADSGFKAFSYRVGLGISKKKKFGVVTDTNSMIGHLYFTRNVPKPVVNPKPPRDGASEDLALISAGDQVTPLTHKRFRKGLNRAFKMGAFFARYAARHPNARWKVYELRTGFDLSLTGRTGLAGINGLGATEINFYNQRF